jgi:alpha-methylacyl-CoA racemase
VSLAYTNHNDRSDLFIAKDYLMPTTPTACGPLAGLRVIHLASWGPGPYAAMLLADLGCEVIVVDRRSPMITTVPPALDPRRRSQQSIALDLKNTDDLDTFRQLLRTADVFIEGMRPGAAERLGIGPGALLELNPRLVYSRMTGWGQTGPLADRAGHDINYIALSGALHAMGAADTPPPVPLNLLGDYGGGGLFLIVGILAALLERERSGQGQVVDGAICDGVASLCAATLGMMGVGRWGNRGSNLFDGSVPWYAVYETADHQYVAVGAIEEEFYQQLLQGLELNPAEWSRRDPALIAPLRQTLTERFKSRDRAHWEARFANTDACVTPVLSFTEALDHPHHLARGTYTHLNNIPQPSPGPRLSRTPLRTPEPAPEPGNNSSDIRARLNGAPDTPCC